MSSVSFSEPAAAAQAALSPVGGVTTDDATRASLVLADGTTYSGYSFGAQQSMSGEVVFNTGMVGYPEALSDPSYRGQILVLTYPLIGNYGVPDMDVKDQFNLPKFFESSTVQISGLIVSEYSFQHSHWNAVKSLGDWLKEHNVPALFGIDTRMITKRIRSLGAVLGKIEFEGQPAEIEDPNKLNLVAQVTTKEVAVYNKGASPRSWPSTAA